ncbi:P-loop containing nucleoside triphosphate hydrolase protein, partial [Mycotypha africana]|uniref:P-loop containing nucleoside triphosphate hydrolase protein n=1 Tax=Mycotypha africana TaxID=64632 RepID=UPI002301606A
DRPTRSRTMSDAPRPDFTISSNANQQQRTYIKDRRLELRRSLYLDQYQYYPSDQQQQINNSNKTITAVEDEEENDAEEGSRVLKSSAPLLDAYGVPMSPAKQQQQQAKTASSNDPFHLPASDLNQKIRVCVRKRPLNRKELDKGDKDVAPVTSSRSLQINEPKLRLDLTKYTEQHSFIFDDVFDLNCPNNIVYERTALPLVSYIFQGGKATCFAYGQTGSGKTHTMLDPKQGLYILAAKDIFAMLRKPENQHLSAWIGLYEIYQGQLYDLLNERKKLFAREDGRNNVIITGLKEYPIDNVEKLIQVFDYGSSIRSTGSTGANDTSSRSHAILQILLKHKMNRKKIHGKLSFIDLAGSERGADRGEADVKTRMEGAEINKSLLALKECIRALDLDKRHTPFRQSKLTQVLKDSFVGHSRTCMIATISPSGSNSEHTLNTLRYADRVKELKGDQGGMKSPRSPLKDDASYTDDDDLLQDDDLDNDDDEFFSNESDILDDDTYDFDDEENILDVDFPHEHEEEYLRESTHFLTSNTQHRSLQKQHGMNSTMINDNTTEYSHRSHQRPNSISFTTQQQQQLLLLQQQQQQQQHHQQQTTQTTSTTSNSSVSIISNESNNSNNSSTVQHNLTKANMPSFISFEKMDEFIKFHRAEIREITECTKKETKLVAHISLDHEPQVTNTKTQGQFIKYLQDLDEILEHKLAAIEALRDRISEAVGQIDI